MKRILKPFISILIAAVCLLGMLMGLAQADDPDAPVILSPRVVTQVYGGVLYGRCSLILEDPNGSVPGTISGITVTGPGGYSCVFDCQSDFWNHTTTGDDLIPFYRHRTPELPPDGEYAFAVTDVEGKTSGATVLYTAAPYTIEMPDIYTYVPSNGGEVNTPTPTLSWDPVSSSSGGTVYYSAWIILDWGSKTLFTPSRIAETSFTVPEGILEPGESYMWGVTAYDSLDPDLVKTRADGNISNFDVTFCTPSDTPSEEYLFERMWPPLQHPWAFSGPDDVAVGRDGTVYVADQRSNRVLVFTEDFRLITQWGGQGAEDGRFSSPRGIAVDSQGNVYVVDAGQNNRIQKFTPDGEFLTAWGTLGAGDGDFNDPQGIAIDANDRVYIADTKNHRIQKFSSDGTFLGKWGSEGLGEGQFSYPFSVTTDSQGNVYVSESTYDFGAPTISRIQKFDSDGGFLLQWGSQGTGDGQFTGLIGIEMDGNDHLYALDRSATREVSVFTSTGQFLFRFPITGASFIWGLCFGRNGDLYITDVISSRVYHYSDQGQYVNHWGATGNEGGRFYNPAGIALSEEGDIYVADYRNERVQRFSPEGAFLQSFGAITPVGIAISSGNSTLYVSQSTNCSIKMYSLEGEDLGGWGTIGTGNGEFNFPSDLDFDSSGNVFVCDAANHRIQKFAADGTYLDQWGSFGMGQGQFSQPKGIAIDAGDNVYVFDSMNHRIQKFDAQMQYLMEWSVDRGGFADSSWAADVGLDVDTEGNVYVVDTFYEHRVMKFTPNGELLSIIGGEGLIPGQTAFPCGLAVDPGGRVYVSEYDGGHNIQVFKKDETGERGRSKAVIVAGGGPYEGNNLWDATQMCANFAYRTLTYQGFTKETLTYLSSDLDLDLDGNDALDDVDGDATNANLQNAIVSGVSDAENVLIYLVDHGGENEFRMSGTEVLTASDLDGWIDSLQSSVTGQVTVVYDACESGSFLSTLSGASRTVLTSTSPGESAYFVTQGVVSFSGYFWSHIFNGVNVKDAFLLAADALETTTSYQHPLLDADGDGTANEAGDYALAEAQQIGNGTVVVGVAPQMAGVSAPQTISGTTAAVLTASGVTDSDGIGRVWGVVVPPDYNQGSTDNPVKGLPTFDMSFSGGDVYTGTYDGFNVAGTYQIAIYAGDWLGNTSIPLLTTVTVENPLGRKAVIAVGAGPADPVWPAVESSVKLAYEALTFQGYPEGDILLLSPASIPETKPPLAPTLSNLDYALNTWAQTDTQDLVLYLVGNGEEGGFPLNENEVLSGVTLDGWLDGLQGSIPGLVTYLYDACRSGSFLSAVTPQAGKLRIQMASAASDEAAHFLSDGDVSFSKYFWRKVLDGMSVRDAFVHAKNAIQYSFATQVPQMDDNGNGVGNEKQDGLLAERCTIGVGIILAGDEPVIGSVVSGQSLYGTPSGALWAEEVTTTGTIDRVWAVILPPGCGGSDPSVPVTALQSVDLLPDGNGRYEGTYDHFTLSGTYSISILAVDTDGNMAMPKSTTVYQDQAIVVKGDVDGSGYVDAADAVIALEVVAGKSPVGIRPDYVSSGADVNGDGKVGMEEAVYIHEILTGSRLPQ